MKSSEEHKIGHELACWWGREESSGEDCERWEDPASQDLRREHDRQGHGGRKSSSRKEQRRAGGTARPACLKHADQGEWGPHSASERLAGHMGL